MCINSVMVKKSEQFDVVIVGGGLAGMTLACLLGQGGVRVACVDRDDPLRAMGADLRTTAVSYGSSRILDRAGIWAVLGERICAIRDLEILDGQSPVLLRFLSGDVEDKSFGWIADNADLRAAMMERMGALETVAHIAPAGVADFEVDGAGAAVILQDGRRLSARLVVGADGRGSFTREWMGVRVRRRDYRQRAVICAAAHENPHENVAVEHFFPAGPFAVLPMHDDADGVHRSSVVFTEHGRERDSLMRLSDAEFEAALQETFPARYGAVKLAGKRTCYPLGLVHAAEYIAPRMALVADAAHGIHPIAGQGLNLGFRDVAKLADLVVEAYGAGADVGSDSLLELYQRARRPDNTAMVAVTDGLNRLFSNNIAPVRGLRKLGLKAVSKIPPAKQFFMRQAMGDKK